MSTVEQIVRSIESLQAKEYNRLRKWFAERDWEKWDKQIVADSVSGKLDFLIQEVRDEEAKKKLKKLWNTKYSQVSLISIYERVNAQNIQPFPEVPWEVAACH